MNLDRPNSPQPPLNRQTELIITAIIAVGLTALAVWSINRLTTPPPTPIAVVDTAEWPTPPPTFTPTAPVATSTPVPTFTSTPLPTLTPTPTPIVVGWRELGYLTSVQYTMQTTVETEREKSLLGIISSKDRVLLMAVGNVQAGIDMTAIKDSNVTISGTSVKIILPPAKVTSVELLPGETQIFDSQQGWFKSDYTGLETEALDKARTQLEHWAVDRNAILKQAEKSARLQLTEFLRQLGFTKIDITFEKLGE